MALSDGSMQLHPWHVRSSWRSRASPATLRLQRGAGLGLLLMELGFLLQTLLFSLQEEDEEEDGEEDEEDEAEEGE